MPMDSLPRHNVFDAETTMEKVKASDGSLAAEQHAAATRELLAKCIIAMVEQGERNPNRLKRML